MPARNGYAAVLTCHSHLAMPLEVTLGFPALQLFKAAQCVRNENDCVWSASARQRQMLLLCQCGPTETASAEKAATSGTSHRWLTYHTLLNTPIQ